MKHYLLPILLIYLFHTTYAQAVQSLPTSSYTQYKKSIKKDKDNQLFIIDNSIAGIKTELAYATADNFVKQPLYPIELNHTYLRKPAFDALLKVIADLKSKQLGVVIFDAYRPHRVTRQFWELIKDERYVAHPSKGSYHNRGLAIDLSLHDLKTDTLLNMGTGFDNFTDTAHHTFQQLPKNVLQNRLLLKAVMEKHGFKALATEWWHYTFQSSSNFTVLDIPFKKLDNKN